MWCVKCNNDLSDCVCPDLQERLNGLGDVLVYRKCLKCNQHYEKCTCSNPEWGTNQAIEGEKK